MMSLLLPLKKVQAVLCRRFIEHPPGYKDMPFKAYERAEWRRLQQAAPPVHFSYVRVQNGMREMPIECFGYANNTNGEGVTCLLSQMILSVM